MSKTDDVIIKMAVRNMTIDFMDTYPFESYPKHIVEKAVHKLFSPELYNILKEHKGLEHGMNVDIFRFLLGKLESKCVNYMLVEQGDKIAVQLETGEEIFINKPTDDTNIH